MDTATASTSAAPAAAPILALDLGKYKSVACAYAGGPESARFDTLTTSREQLRALFARERPAAVVIEACLLAGWVHDLCHELGLACHVANTASEAWKFKHTKRKTDKDDALRLASSSPWANCPPSRCRRRGRWPASIPRNAGMRPRSAAAVRSAFSRAVPKPPATVSSPS